MFIIHYADGKTLTEKDAGDWDHVPDNGITSIQLTLPFDIKRINDKGEQIDTHTPVVTLSNYDHYYCAKEAVALIMGMAGHQMDFKGGQGTVVKEVLAGIDEKHDLVIYLEVDRKANVTIKRFPISDLKVRPATLRRGEY